jgi:hypothetical protein
MMVELRTSTESMKGEPPPVPSEADLARLGQKAAHMTKIGKILSDGIDEEAEGSLRKLRVAEEVCLTRKLELWVRFEVKCKLKLVRTLK